MAIKIKDYRTKIFKVRAIELTQDNIEEAMAWGSGDVWSLIAGKPGPIGTRVRLHEDKGRKFPALDIIDITWGDYLVETAPGQFKFMTGNAFCEKYEATTDLV